jgi:hypothetical protein
VPKIVFDLQLADLPFEKVSLHLAGRSLPCRGAILQDPRGTVRQLLFPITRKRLDVQLKAKVAPEALPQRGGDRRASGEVSASPEPDLRLKKQLIEGAAPVFSSGPARRRAGTLRLRVRCQDRSAHGGAAFFITEVRAMSRGEHVAMIDRGCADLSVR